MRLCECLRLCVSPSPSVYLRNLVIASVTDCRFHPCIGIQFTPFLYMKKHAATVYVIK